MSSGIYNFTIEQGVTFNRVIIWQDEAGDPVDMTGMTARMQIRSRNRLLLAEPSVVVDAPVGKITVSLSDEATEDLIFDTAVYDLEISQDGEVVERLIKGVVTLDRESTLDE
ncbi:hypothetical protein ACLQ2Q_21740 [Microbacterium sp. DT81.1]|uniref:hypothetical protein n=1 Tax=Microbacterium sp. DT81.1 TaxID=3393413 RepID=UPI003CF0C179